MWRFALSLAILAAAGGCKSSSKSVGTTAAPRAATSPVAATTPVQAKPATKTPTASEREPDLENGVPAKTFQVQPPASFTSDQLPENSIVEFRLTAKAGQVLHLRMKEDEWYLLVQGPGVGIPGGDNEGNRLYTLPETGAYRVVGQYTANQGTNGKNTVIQLALLNIDDPLVDPGIRPEQISLDAGDFVADAKWSLVPYSHFEGSVVDPWPSHLALRGGHLQFRIMPIAGYKKIVSSDDMDKLQTALRENGKGADARKFPYSSYGDAV